MVWVYLCPDAEPRDRLTRLREAASRFTGRDASGWTRCVREGGKPYFAEAPELAFSVSHSGDWWACAFGDAPLGLDLERHAPRPFLRLAARFFLPEEAEAVRAAADTAAAFYRIWCAKEAVLKRSGAGLSGGLRSFSVCAPLPDGAALHYPAAPAGYTLCLCTAGPAALRTEAL